ncbi:MULTISPECIES: hypothetical protein [unclassified Phyllobacterium]|uniref:hypothetical protein n=1 Tax=unclassified Phyllobacterium TaxID=2638441 RepID=UPI003012E924
MAASSSAWPGLTGHVRDLLRRGIEAACAFQQDGQALGDERRALVGRHVGNPVRLPQSDIGLCHMSAPPFR